MPSVFYPRKLIRDAADMNLQTATIAVGKGMIWQGLVDVTGAKQMLEMADAARDAEAELRRVDDASLDGARKLLTDMEVEDAFKAGHAAAMEMIARQAVTPPPPPPPPEPPAKKKRSRK